MPVKVWISANGVLQREDFDEICKSDRNAFEKYRKGLKEWMASPRYGVHRRARATGPAGYLCKVDLV